MLGQNRHRQALRIIRILDAALRQRIEAKL
jgi:hypothetical protein